MYDGYQVLRFENNYKSKDLYLIGNEMNNRIGTGNYGKERTKFNIKYKELEKDNLYQDVKYKLESRNIEYLHKTKTNILNGCVITSGQEFFKSLGMQFEDTDEVHTEGKHKGEPIQKALIKAKEDIPEKVLEYFNYSNEFMCNLVGKENVVYSAIHFDENTPHMHFYFTPVVHEVKRKVFETDKDGHQILKPYITKDGIEKMIPVQKKDEIGKTIYKSEYGNFLNSDQFWKEKGFKTSYAKI